MRRSIHKRHAFAILLTLLLAFPAELHAIQWRGQFSYAKVSALSARSTNVMAFGATSSAFVGGIGGMSFDQVAEPAHGLKISSLEIHYNPQKEDGRRLDLIVNGKKTKVSLYDWLSIPIAKYADSPYYSCFTLFGKLENKKLEEKITEQGGRIMNYHPEFENTLLGLRLFHMDILIMYEHTIDLPIEEGRYLLGKGETVPDVLQNREGLHAFGNHMNTVQRRLQQIPRSFIITDFTRTISFSINDDSLRIVGTPYYFFWRYKQDRPSYDQSAVQDSIKESLEKELAEKRKKNPDFNARQWIVNRVLKAADEYQGKHSFYAAGTFMDLISQPSEVQRRAFLEQYATESLFELLVKTKTGMDAYTVDHLKDYSREISNRPELLRGINPPVWDATVATMRYAAFFRYIKKRFPMEWKAFMTEIRHVSVEPTVETPTVMYPKGNEVIEQALQKLKKR